MGYRPSQHNQTEAHEKPMWWHDMKKWWTHFFLNQFAYSFLSCNNWACLDAIPPAATWENWKQGWAARFVSSSMMNSWRRGKMGSSHMLHYISDQLWFIFPFACVHTVCPQRHCAFQYSELSVRAHGIIFHVKMLIPHQKNSDSLVFSKVKKK